MHPPSHPHDHPTHPPTHSSSHPLIHSPTHPPFIRSVVLGLLQFTYAPVSYKIFQTFMCDDEFDDGSSYLSVDYSINCHGHGYQVSGWGGVTFQKGKRLKHVLPQRRVPNARLKIGLFHSPTTTSRPCTPTRF